MGAEPDIISAPNPPSSWRRNLPTLVGLSLPLGCAVLMVVAYLIKHPSRREVVIRGVHRLANGSYVVDPSSRSTMAIGTSLSLSVDLVSIAGLLLLVAFWERRSLRSVGLRWPTRRDWGSTAVACLLWFPMLIAIGKLLPAPFHEDRNLRVALMVIPLGLRLLLLLFSPFFEELLFRAYLIERTEELTGSTWLALGVSVLSSTLLHLGWGGGALVGIAPMNAILAGFYIWRRNLPVSTVLHIVADSPIVWWPLLAHTR